MAGLNPTEMNEIDRDHARASATAASTILLIEHVMQAVMSLSDDIYVLA